MTTATIAVVGSLVGVVLGSALSFLAQYLLAKRTRKWKLEDTKRESYAEFLTSISASYAKAKAGQGDPEEVDLLRATAVIELIAGKQIAEQARGLQKQVTCGGQAGTGTRPTAVSYRLPRYSQPSCWRTPTISR